VYIEHHHGGIHPVSFELIGKARELAQKIGHPVYALLMGQCVREMAEEVRHYGVDAVYVYEHPQLDEFRIEPYSAAFEAFIREVKPSTMLVGGTTVGRSLAPRVAARFRTGLTADCTFLDIQGNTDLDQIRPAFGGNIMAHIRTPNHRPQFATVRYRIFNAPKRSDAATGDIRFRELQEAVLASRIRVLEVMPKPHVQTLEEAEVIVVAGRGVRRERDLDMVHELAESLDGQMATTRPLIEAGWADARRQIGLSGRTVKPKLIITCGVSGAIQFVAGMKGSDCIVAVNNDPEASIFKIAHYGLVGDLYEIVPCLVERIQQTRHSVALRAAD
jgi:electron transfer flavoprotein alpha subunit